MAYDAAGAIVACCEGEACAAPAAIDVFAMSVELLNVMRARWGIRNFCFYARCCLDAFLRLYFLVVFVYVCFALFCLQVVRVCVGQLGFVFSDVVRFSFRACQWELFSTRGGLDYGCFLA